MMTKTTSEVHEFWQKGNDNWDGLSWVAIPEIRRWLQEEIHRSGAPTQILEEFDKQTKPPHKPKKDGQKG